MAVASIPMVSVRFKRPYQGHRTGDVFRLTPGYADSLRRWGYVELMPDEPEPEFFRAVAPEPPGVERAVAAPHPKARRKRR